MNHYRPGRWTAQGEDEVTVFLIGMRMNRPARVDKWAPVAKAMMDMQKYLARNPQDGCLGHHQWFGRTTIMVSYWRSPEDLQRFASNPDAPHMAAWRRFSARDGGVTGIWHETYRVRPGDREAIYANMPPFGLGRALTLVPVGQGQRTAKQRMASKL